jgi:hypothetical protein
MNESSKPMDDTRRIIIAGFPKSGNTWLARLTAELVGCPVAGLWGHPELRDQIIEGDQRVSPWRCHKAHDTFDQLGLPEGDACRPIVVCVVRHPCDVAVSASHYFDFKRYIRPKLHLRAASAWLRLWGNNRHGIGLRLQGEQRRLDITINAVIHGDQKLSQWCNVPWAQHVQGFRIANVPLVRYEDLLADTEAECRRLLDCLGIERSAEPVREAVAMHSFNREKERFTAAGAMKDARLLHKGQAGQWRNCLSSEQLAIFRDPQTAEVMRQLNYSL